MHKFILIPFFFVCVCVIFVSVRLPLSSLPLLSVYPSFSLSFSVSNNFRGFLFCSCAPPSATNAQLISLSHGTSSCLCSCFKAACDGDITLVSSIRVCVWERERDICIEERVTSPLIGERGGGVRESALYWSVCGGVPQTWTPQMQSPPVFQKPETEPPKWAALLIRTIHKLGSNWWSKAFGKQWRDAMHPL